MNRRRALILGLSALATAILGGAPAQAIAGPLYDIHADWADTVLPPGGEGQFMVVARNIGDGAGSEALTITDELPAGVTVKAIRFDNVTGAILSSSYCSGTGTAVAKCTLQGSELASLAPAPGTATTPFGLSPKGYLPVMYVEVEIDESVSGTGTNKATLAGGSGPGPVSDVDEVPFGNAPAEFGFVPGTDGFEADFFNAAYPFGSPSRTAGDHPFELRTNFDLTRKVGENHIFGPFRTVNRPLGLARTFEVTLPRGIVGNPEATPKCDPLKFAEGGASGSSTGCPSNTQAGYITILTNESIGTTSRVAIYNLEPPKRHAV